jgi:hypothetical protein
MESKRSIRRGVNFTIYVSCMYLKSTFEVAIIMMEVPDVKHEPVKVGNLYIQ